MIAAAARSPPRESAFHDLRLIDEVVHRGRSASDVKRASTFCGELCRATYNWQDLQIRLEC
jgi:hypothetical protein